MKYQKIGSRVLFGDMTISDSMFLEHGYMVTLCFSVQNNGVDDFFDISLTEDQLRDLIVVINSALDFNSKFSIKDRRCI